LPDGRYNPVVRCYAGKSDFEAITVDPMNAINGSTKIEIPEPTPEPDEEMAQVTTAAAEKSVE
jgi:hypothetical protein